MEQKVNDLMASTIQKIRESVDANTVVGTPIQAGEVTIIPVSKVSFGFGTGGTEFGAKTEQKAGSFGGGGGAGVKVTPVCFLVISGSNVKILPMDAQPETSIDRMVEMIPDVVTKLSDLVGKKKKGPDIPE